MTTMPVKILRDENNDAFVPFISLDAIEKTEGESLGQALDKKLESHNIKAGNQITIDVDGNDITINNDAAGMNIINNLETETAGLGSLDAHQGKVLKDSIPEIVNNLNTIDSTKALSAHQGYILAGRSVPTGGANGQVLKKSADNDYALEWGDAADPNAIIGDGTIKKIVELTYEEYMDLVDAGTIDNATEYHINNWTEEWHSDRELMEQFVVNIELSLPSFQVTSIDQYSEAIINAYNEGKFIIGYIRFAGGTVVCPLDMIEGSSIYFQPVLRFFNNGVLMTYATRLTVTTSSANLALMRILTEEDYDAIATELNDVLKGVGVRLTNNEAIDEGQNTRLDIAEGNIDAIVGTVNTLSSNLSKTMKMVYDGSSGGSSAYKDTGLPIEAGYGGGAYLVTMTWHLSSGDPTGTTVDIISLPYSGTNFTTYRICELRNNANYSKHLLYQASENKTLMIGVGGSGDAKIHIYKL